MMANTAITTCRHTPNRLNFPANMIAKASKTPPVGSSACAMRSCPSATSCPALRRVSSISAGVGASRSGVMTSRDERRVVSGRRIIAPMS